MTRTVKTCCVFNIAPHYRSLIYQQMDKELNCDFYFGDKIETNIKQMDVSTLKGFKRILPIHYLHKHLYWQKGAVSLLFKPYSHYILTGDFWGLSAWILILLAPIFGKKTYLWTHGLYGKEGIAKRILKRLYFGATTANFIYGEKAIDRMVAAGYPKSKHFCIANSLDYEEHLRIRAALKNSDIYLSHFGNDDPVLIYVGRLQKVKRIELLLETVEKMAQDGIKVNAILVGSDVDGLNVEEWLDEHKLQDRVWVYGPCYDEEKLAELFYNATVCVSPGNVGLTVIHAFSFGCPVITHGNFVHQMPEAEAIMDGVTGAFFKEDDGNDLKEKIQQWISKTVEEREEVRKLTYQEIDRKWNPAYQIGVLKKVLL